MPLLTHNCTVLLLSTHLHVTLPVRTEVVLCYEERLSVCFSSDSRFKTKAEFQSLVSASLATILVNYPRAHGALSLVQGRAVSGSRDGLSNRVFLLALHEVEESLLHRETYSCPV